jgi:hypothetical protein
MTIAYSCKKKSTGGGGGGGGGSTKDDIVVEIPYTKTKVLDSIPPLPLSLPVDITDTFATRSDEYLGLYGFTKDKVKRVSPMSMNVAIDNLNTQTLDFVDDSVKIFVDAYNGTNPTLVAYAKGIPLGAKSINFTIVDTDIKDYFNSDYMQVSLKFNTRPGQGMQQGTNFISNFKFKIVAAAP